MAKINLKNSLLVIASVIILLGTWIRFAQVANYNFPFTTDQARDMLDLRNIVVGHHLTLVGPTTSINGVFLGPSYYYFNILPFIVGQGNPSALVYWNILFYLIASVLLLLLHIKKELIFGFFSSILFIMAPGLFQSTRYFWNSNCMPYFTVFFFVALAFYLLKPSRKKAFLVGLISGISMQFQAAFGILFFPFSLITSGLKKVGWKNIGIQCLGFFVTLLPQVLFELKHHFGMTKIFLAEFSGSGDILGDKLTFLKALENHYHVFIEFSHGIIALPYNLDSVLLIAAICFLGLQIYQKKLNPVVKTYSLLSFGFLVFAFIFYLVYLHELKGWFVIGLRVPYILLLASFFTAIYQHTLSIKQPKNLLQTATIALLLVAVIFSYLDQKQFIPNTADFRSNDKSNFRNELEEIDWVYQHTNGQGFKAYNYIASVYDFPYQYLYWWYATPKYGYQPETITYKDNVPEYITNNTSFLTKTKPQTDNLIAMIYEDDENSERWYSWGGNFTKFCRRDGIQYPWGTNVEIRRPCQPGEDSPALRRIHDTTVLETMGYIIKNDQILLAQVDYGKDGLKWEGISGLVQKDESLKQSLIRSFKEKTGLTIDRLNAIHSGELNYDTKQIDVFTVTDFTGNLNIKDPEVKDIRWFNIKDIPYKQMTEDNRMIIPELLSHNFIRLNLGQFTIYPLQ